MVSKGELNSEGSVNRKSNKDIINVIEEYREYLKSTSEEIY